jgi:hypothetical protein
MRMTLTNEMQEEGGEEPCPGVMCPGGELRCDCGSLLARVVGSHVELKCRRCKRIQRIPIESEP